MPCPLLCSALLAPLLIVFPRLVRRADRGALALLRAPAQQDHDRLAVLADLRRGNRVQVVEPVPPGRTTGSVEILENAYRSHDYSNLTVTICQALVSIVDQRACGQRDDRALSRASTLPTARVQPLRPFFRPSRRERMRARGAVLR